MTVTEQIQSFIQGLTSPLEIKTIELELPDRCECGFQNLNIHGTRTNGRLVIDVRCMSCGKPLSRVEQS